MSTCMPYTGVCVAWLKSCLRSEDLGNKYMVVRRSFVGEVLVSSVLAVNHAKCIG